MALQTQYFVGLVGWLTSSEGCKCLHGQLLGGGVLPLLTCGQDAGPVLPPKPLTPPPPPCLQIDYYCRLDILWKKKFKKEHEEFETMENVNRLLLENVLPAHVAAHFIGDKLNEVWCEMGLGCPESETRGRDSPVVWRLVPWALGLPGFLGDRAWSQL